MNKFPVVILPGWMLGSSRYLNLKKEFNKLGHRAYVIDFPGFEQGSKLSRVYDLTDYVKFVQKYLRQQKITQAIFIAHSFGGRVALKYLSQEPHKAVCLILSGTPGYMPVSKIKLHIFLVIAKVGGKIFSLPILNKIKDLIRKIYYKIIGARDFYHTEGTMRETFKNIIKEPLVDYMRKIRIPVFLLWGEKDKVVPVSVAKSMQKTIVKSKLYVIPDSSHMFICKEFDMATKYINEFINNL